MIIKKKEKLKLKNVSRKAWEKGKKKRCDESSQRLTNEEEVKN